MATSEEPEKKKRKMATSKLKEISSSKCFGGMIRKFEHVSPTLGGLPAKFQVFLPAGASSDNKVPWLLWLSGLTCTEDNFIHKAGGQRAASLNNVALVCPDTSPRGAGVEGEDEGWDFGTGAGFYVNSTNGDFAKNYHMYDYCTKELPELVLSELPLQDNCSIFGHSMGGHGALTLYLKNPGKYKSCSAFSPICNPLNCPWGHKAFNGYLGSVEAGAPYDATELMKGYSGDKVEILIDQGGADSFLEGKQLLPEAFVDAANKNGNYPVNYRLQEGYGHGYDFIATFVDDHINYHAKCLAGRNYSPPGRLPHGKSAEL